MPVGTAVVVGTGAKRNGWSDYATPTNIPLKFANEEYNDGVVTYVDGYFTVVASGRYRIHVYIPISNQTGAPVNATVTIGSGGSRATSPLQTIPAASGSKLVCSYIGTLLAGAQVMVVLDVSLSSSLSVYGGANNVPFIEIERLR